MGRDIRSFGKGLNFRLRDKRYYFRQGITWGRIGNGRLSVRFSPCGFVFGDAGTTAYFESESQLFLALGALLSNSSGVFLEALAPTMNFQVYHIEALPFPCFGELYERFVDEIKENALAFFNAQSRAVTSEDYVIRTHAMPTKYGTVAKAYAVKDDQINNILRVNEGNFVETAINPTAINLYTLGYNKNKKLTTLNSLTKDNLARYLEQFRLLTDDVNILDAFVINIGVKFDITVFKNYNIKDVLARSIDAVNQHFNIDNWSINQPIILTDLSYEIGSVEGVQNVSNLQIFNKYLFKDGSDYQPYRYDIPQATVDNVIYPSLDPSIFELRYPETDIIGSAIQ
jgi:hypothetical protein